MVSTKLANIGQLVTYDSISKAMILKEDVEIVLDGEKIIDIGHSLSDADELINCNGMLVTPGFVDSHTHPVFLNGREDEFEMRLNGKTYEDIANAGGGIINSTNGVRKSTEAELISKVRNRMDKFLALGTTTIECKSGYGLDKQSEIKSLKVIHEVNKIHNIDMVATFMGAHAFPEEFKNDHDSYVDLICEEIIPAVAKQGIAEFNDVFCEVGYFNEEQTRKIILRGKEYNLIPRMHADEFTNSGSAVIAGDVRAISADHLMAVSNEGIEALSENNVIATLLPGTTFFLGKKEYAPYKKLKNAGIDVALATDYNPGSCNIQSMPFIVSLACIYLEMNILDAIKASTYIAAKSLMRNKDIGSIEKGKNADLIVWNIDNVQQIPYTVTNHPIQYVFKNGICVFTA